MLVKCANPDCEEVFEKRSSNHVVCDNPDCKKYWYGLDKEAKKGILDKRFVAMFTNTQREVIVECLEFRKKTMTYKQIAAQIFSTKKAVEKEVERMRGTCEYAKIKLVVKRQRGKA